MFRRLLSAPIVAFMAALFALTPVGVHAAGNGPGAGQPFGIDWTPIVFWVIVGGVIIAGFALGILIDWGNR